MSSIIADKPGEAPHHVAQPELSPRLDSITPYANRLSLAVQTLRQLHARYLAPLRQSFDREIARLAKEFQVCYDEVDLTYQKRLQEIDEDYLQTLTRLRQKWLHVQEDVPWLCHPWQHPAWDEYDPAANTTVPKQVRVGEYQIANARDELGSLPALVPLIGAGHLFVQGKDQAATRAFWNSILLRMVVSFPPGSLRLLLFDPMDMGLNLVHFLHLPDMLRSPKVFASRSEIDHQLEQISEHIESVIQTRLLNFHTSFEQYNAETGEVGVPYQIVAFANFPTGLEERSLQRLLHIARIGPRAGVYLVAHLDSARTGETDSKLAPLLEHLVASGRTLTLENNQVSSPEIDLKGYPVCADLFPDAQRVNHWLSRIGRTLVEASAALDFARIHIPPSARWSQSSMHDLSVPIGIRANGLLHWFVLGREAVHHGLIGGVIGSGKSNLLHIIIMQLALAYSPDELELYLVDFKEGVEFQDYVSLPHARAVGLESEREFGLSILRRLRDAMEARGRLYKAQGGAVNDLPSYRQHSGEVLPRILLIMDEFQVLFAEDDYLSREAARIMEDIVRRGRAFGIHLLLASQSPSMAGVYGNRIYNQMGLRVALRCRVQDAQAILGEGNDAASRLTRAGEAIYNDEMGYRERNIFLRIAWLPPAARQESLHAIQALAATCDYPAPVTFAGQTPAYLETNPHFQSLFAEPDWPPPAPITHVWLGQPVEIKAPTSAPLERYVRSNLLLVGGSEAEGYSLLLAALLSIAVQRAPETVHFYIADFARTSSAYANLFPSLNLPHPVELYNLHQNAASSSQLLDQLTKTVRQRLDGTESAESEIFLLIAGLHRWRELRGADLYGQTEAAKQLQNLADEGPELGVHLIAWADSFTTLERIFRRSGINVFDLRVLARVSESDSNQLLGSPAAARIEDNRGLYRHEDWEMRRTEKFKPYAISDEATLHHITQSLRDKARKRSS